MRSFSEDDEWRTDSWCLHYFCLFQWKWPSVIFWICLLSVPSLWFWTERRSFCPCVWPLETSVKTILVGSVDEELTGLFKFLLLWSFLLFFFIFIVILLTSLKIISNYIFKLNEGMRVCHWSCIQIILPVLQSVVLFSSVISWPHFSVIILLGEICNSLYCCKDEVFILFYWNTDKLYCISIFLYWSFNTDTDRGRVNFDLSRSGPSSSPLAVDAAERKNKDWWDVRAERAKQGRKDAGRNTAAERWRTEVSKRQKEKKDRNQKTDGQVREWM